MLEKDWSNYYQLLICDSQLCSPLSTKLDFKTATIGVFWVNIRSFVFPANNTSGLGFSLETLKPSKNHSHFTYIPYLAWDNWQLLKSPTMKLKTIHLSVIEKPDVLMNHKIVLLWVKFSTNLSMTLVCVKVVVYSLVNQILNVHLCLLVHHAPAHDNSCKKNASKMRSWGICK